jgi:ADP-heptose:LPS heptosyltransferase
MRDASIRSILLIRYSALGDVVLATSVIEPLRRRFPGARIEWVTSPAAAPLLAGLPGIAEVHRLGRQGADAPVALARRLRGRFDLAIDLQEKVKSRYLAMVAAPRRLYFHRRTFGEALGAIFGVDRPLTRAHATELYAEVLRPLGVEGAGRIGIAVPEPARARARELLAPARRPLVGIAPGATWATKRWAPERFAALADALHEAGHGLVLVAGPGDAAAAGAFRAALRSPLEADLTSLPVDALAAALAELKLLVACDSGPVHLAAAQGVPALVLFGPTSTVRWAPPPPGRALSLRLECQPCSNHGGERCPLGHHDCMGRLEVGTVLAAARELLA